MSNFTRRSESFLPSWETKYVRPPREYLSLILSVLMEKFNTLKHHVKRHIIPYGVVAAFYYNYTIVREDCPCLAEKAEIAIE